MLTSRDLWGGFWLVITSCGRWLEKKWMVAIPPLSISFSRVFQIPLLRRCDELFAGLWKTETSPDIISKHQWFHSAYLGWFPWKKKDASQMWSSKNWDVSKRCDPQKSCRGATRKTSNWSRPLSLSSKTWKSWYVWKQRLWREKINKNITLLAILCDPFIP